MKNIFIKDTQNTVNYLTPQSLKQLLITVGIKLVLAVAGMLAMPVGDYTGFAKILLSVLLFSFVYDVCCLYQVCLHVTQGILMSFLLFLVLIFAIGFIFQYGAALFAGASPATAAGENILMSVMTLIFLIPFLIDIVRLIKMLLAQKKEAARR